MRISANECVTTERAAPKQRRQSRKRRNASAMLSATCSLCGVPRGAALARRSMLTQSLSVTCRRLPWKLVDPACTQGLDPRGSPPAGALCTPAASGTEASPHDNPQRLDMGRRALAQGSPRLPHMPPQGGRDHRPKPRAAWIGPRRCHSTQPSSNGRRGSNPRGRRIAPSATQSMTFLLLLEGSEHPSKRRSQGNHMADIPGGMLPHMRARAQR